MEYEKIGRRLFLSTSAMSLLGYAACVAIPEPERKRRGRDDLPKPIGKSAARSEIGRRIESATPAGNRILFKNSQAYSPASERFMDTFRLDCDLLVAGGGLAGVSAALAAARHGAKVVLVQNRSRLGGNSSSEIKMHPLGIWEFRTGFREGGIIEELKLEDISVNTQRSWEMWDLMLYDKVISEPNIALLLDTTVFSVETEGDKISCVYARSDTSLKIYKITAKNYADCTGDGRLAMEAGAEMMWGRDGSGKYGEDLVDDRNPHGTLCSSLLFTTTDTGKPAPYKAPAWAKKITAADLRFRDPKRNGFQFGYFFISHGGLSDAIRDTEVIRFELLSVVLGLWEYIKTCGKYPETENLALDTVGMIPARRESYRIRGLHLFTQHDIYGGWKNYPDQVATCGWLPEDQPSGGIFEPDVRPVLRTRKTSPYNMPLRVMISKDFSNLSMAGRNMSCSHLAFSCTRVMCTGSVMGQALGTAAALAAKHGAKLADFTENKALINELQQELLRDGQIIMGVPNLDPTDLARKAEISSNIPNSNPAAVNNGKIYDVLKSDANKWIAPLSEKPELTLSWRAPQKISKIIFNFDAGRRHLCITKEASRRRLVLEAPQPEVLKDYDVIASLADGSTKTIIRRRGNYQKRVIENFSPVSASSITVRPLATNGDSHARIFELRVFYNS